jgi:hypothetical protein
MLRNASFRFRVSRRPRSRWWGDDKVHNVRGPAVEQKFNAQLQIRQRRRRVEDLKLEA